MSRQRKSFSTPWMYGPRRKSSGQSSTLRSIFEEDCVFYAEPETMSEGTTFCNSPTSSFKQFDFRRGASTDSETSTIVSDSDDASTVSTVSTNYTESNLPGAGRLLGNLYSKAGRRLEKAIHRLVHRAGYGPESSYTKLLNLYRDQSEITDAEAKDALKHCKKLIDYASSGVQGTRAYAIEKLIELFKVNKLVAFVLSSDNGGIGDRFADLMQSIERTAYRTVPQQHQILYDSALSEFSKVDIHKAGIVMLSMKDKDLDQSWKSAFKQLICALRDPEYAPLSVWYLSWWPAIGIDMLFDPDLALELCDSLAAVLTDHDRYNSVDLTNLSEISYYVHEYLLNHMEFLAPFRPGGVSFKTYLVDTGAEALDEYVDFRESVFRIPDVINRLNDFAMAYNDNKFRPEMEVLREYASAELVYERISRALEEIPDSITVTQVTALETIAMKLCIELLDYARCDKPDGSSLTKRMYTAEKLYAVEKLASILKQDDVFPWFLSVGPQGLETSFLNLIKDLEILRSLGSMEEHFGMLDRALACFSLVRVHKAGVSLLEAKSEKLRFTSNGVHPEWDCTVSPVGVSSWETLWSDSFNVLLEHLQSPKTAYLALHYLCYGHCSTQRENKRTHTTLLENALSHFNPLLSLKLCIVLRTVLMREELFKVVNRSTLFWISNRILKYLLARLSFLEERRGSDPEEEFEDFQGARLNVPDTVDILAALGEAHMMKAVENFARYADSDLYTRIAELRVKTGCIVDLD